MLGVCGCQQLRISRFRRWPETLATVGLLWVESERVRSASSDHLIGDWHERNGLSYSRRCGDVVS